MNDHIVRDGYNLVFPMTAFFTSGFEHSVANVFLIPIGKLVKDVPGVATALKF